MLRVADLFCGPGGISEGLRLAGFKIVFGLDKIKSTAETFQKNHPEALVLCQDASSFSADSMPEFDVLVGGPPCVNFSSSKGSRANVLEGLRLVQVFLRVVYERNPKFWIMENVPGLCLHLPETIPLSWIGIDKPGELHIPIRKEFNTADYGVAQIRRRYLVGNYPVPEPTHKENSKPLSLFNQEKTSLNWRTLGEILNVFPSPNTSSKNFAVTDPNYGFQINCDLLSDHFYDVKIPPTEVRRIRDAKIAHPYMGKMAFPDRLDRPARTVVATQLGRETLVIEENGSFRRATIRECATIQSFPITYQFWANSINARYKMAGDAVPPLLAYAIGKKILEKEGHTVPLAPIVNSSIKDLSPPVEFKPRTTLTVLPFDKSFKQLVPGKEIRGCRVEFDNLGTNDLGPSEKQRIVKWTSRLHVGEGKNFKRERIFTFEEAIWELCGFCEGKGPEATSTLQTFFKDVASLAGKVPDAATLQGIWTRRATGLPGPQEIADILSELVEKHFPAATYGNHRLPRSGKFEIVPARGLLVRIAAALTTTAFVAELANEDTSWIEENEGARYWPDGCEKLPEKQHRAKDPATTFKMVMKARKLGEAPHPVVTKV